MATVEVAVGTPLAEALQNVVQPKLAEVGWATGSDDNALSEYIILMLVNGKTQDQIASELSNDLLALGPEDSGAIDFSRWLFEQVQLLNAQLNGGAASVTAPAQPAQSYETTAGAVQHDGEMDGASGSVENDADMGDAADAAQGSIPTGPKAMRNGNQKTRDKRMLGQLNKALDRSGDASLHRVRATTGAGRINSHAGREPPRGPRSQQLQRGIAMANGRPTNVTPMLNTSPGGLMMPQPGLAMSPEQQMQFYKLLEQQAQMMAMFASQGAGVGGPAINPAFQNAMPSTAQQHGKSLFDRVQGKGGRYDGSFQNKRHHQQMGSAQAQADTVMSGDAQASTPLDSALTPTRNPSETVCKFNLACTKPDCPFVHQSPAAPPNIAIDMSDTCSFGAACKNHKCVGKHPSPAQRTMHQAEQDCKYWPNCTNPHCPFRHPSVAPCRNGADCNVPGCTFWHNPVMCKYDPCTNAKCPYKHAEGQKRGRFADKVWKADGADKAHVSERKFVDENGGEEELILPGSGDSQADGAVTGDPQTQTETRIIV